MESAGPRSAAETDIPLARSLRGKFILLLAILIALTATVLTIIDYIYVRQLLTTSVQEQLTLRAEGIREVLLAHVRQRSDGIRLVASQTRLRELLEERLDGELDEDAFRATTSRMLLDAQQSTEGFLNTRITDPAGMVVTATDVTHLGADLSGSRAFLDGMREPTLGVAGAGRGQLQRHAVGARSEPCGALPGRSDRGGGCPAGTEHTGGPAQRFRQCRGSARRLEDPHRRSRPDSLPVPRRAYADTVDGGIGGCVHADGPERRHRFFGNHRLSRPPGAFGAHAGRLRRLGDGSPGGRRPGLCPHRPDRPRVADRRHCLLRARRTDRRTHRGGVHPPGTAAGQGGSSGGGRRHDRAGTHRHPG